MLTRNSKDAPTNPRGIPYAPFVDRVEDYVASRAEVDGTMKSFQEMISYASMIQYPRFHFLIVIIPAGNTNSWKLTPQGELGD